MALNGDLGRKLGVEKRAHHARELLILVTRLQKLEDAYTTDGNMVVGRRLHGKMLKLQDLTARNRDVNIFIRRYVSIPVVLPERTGFGYHWQEPGKYQGSSLDRSLVVHALELLQAHRILSVRRCAQCSRWFFARFSHQKYCSEPCKQLFHRSDPAVKEARRQWARENYWTHKNKNTK